MCAFLVEEELLSYNENTFISHIVRQYNKLQQIVNMARAQSAGTFLVPAFAHHSLNLGRGQSKSRSCVKPTFAFTRRAKEMNDKQPFGFAEKDLMFANVHKGRNYASPN